MSTFYVFLRWLTLSIASIVSIKIVFKIYTIANPQTLGFMGDETPYGFEGMFLFLLLLIYLGLNFIPTTIWQRKREQNAALKVLLYTFIIQSMVTSALLLGPLFYYRWFVAN